MVFPCIFKLNNVHVRRYIDEKVLIYLIPVSNLVSRLIEEHRLRVLENIMIRKISGAKEDEITG